MHGTADRVFLVSYIAVIIVGVRQARAARVTQALGTGVEAFGEVRRGVVGEVVRVGVLVEAVRDLQEALSTRGRVAVVVKLLQAALRIATSGEIEKCGSTPTHSLRDCQPIL